PVEPIRPTLKVDREQAGMSNSAYLLMESGEGRSTVPKSQQFEPGGTSTSSGLSFEAVAKTFSLKREATTPNPPFTDVKSVFEGEAPTTAQRRLALDFFNGIAQFGRPYYPSPLDIVELHQLH